MVPVWDFVLSGQPSDQLPQGPGSTGRMNVAQTLRDPAARPENIQMKLRVPVLRADSFPGDGRAAFGPAHIPGFHVGRWQGPGLTAAQRRAGRGAHSRKRGRAWRPSGVGAAAPQEPGPSPPLLPPGSPHRSIRGESDGEGSGARPALASQTSSRGGCTAEPPLVGVFVWSRV